MAKKERLINAISYYPSFDQSELHFEYFWADSLCIGRFESSPENKLPVCVHSHEEYEFIIPYSPVNYMLREEQICFGQVGQVYPIPGGIRHGIKYTQSEPVSLDAISIDKEYFDAIKKEKHLESLAIENEFTLSRECVPRRFISTKILRRIFRLKRWLQSAEFRRDTSQSVSQRCLQPRRPSTLLWCALTKRSCCLKTRSSR